MEAEEYRELDGERVLVLTQYGGRGKTSGLQLGEIRSKGANVVHIRGGKVTKCAFYFDRERALADLGLASGRLRVTASTNVEIVRRALEAATRRPKPDFAEMNDLYHPDHEFISRIDALEGGSHRGGRGYRDWRLDAEEAVAWESRLEKVTKIDNDRVLAITPTRSQGKSSGVTLDEEPMSCIVTVRGGKIIRTEVYSSPEEALEAAGSREGDVGEP
jgi:ketosteroid isomerase-like protein